MLRPTNVDWPNIVDWAQNPINPSKGKMIAHVHSSVIEKQLPCCTPTPFLMSLMFNQWRVELEGWTTW
jgi:hypothetical protein